DDDDLVVNVPGGAAERSGPRRRQRAQVAPGVRRQVVGPDAAVVEVDLAEPLPAVVAAEGAEAEEAAADGVEDVLLGAADAGRGGVRSLEGPAGGVGVVGPQFVARLAAAALVVSGPADHQAGARVVGQRRLVAEARRRRPALGRAALDPGVRLLGDLGPLLRRQ